MSYTFIGVFSSLSIGSVKTLIDEELEIGSNVSVTIIGGYKIDPTSEINLDTIETLLDKVVTTKMLNLVPVSEFDGKVSHLSASVEKRSFTLKGVPVDKYLTFQKLISEKPLMELQLTEK